MSTTKTRAEAPARSKIRSAAEELFCTTGFEGTSVATIADRAGVTKAAVFYHYGSKEKLFEEVLDGYYARQHDLFTQALAGEADPRARLHQLVDVYFRSLVENRRYLMLVISVLASNSPHTSNIRKSVLPVIEWLTREVKGALPTEGSRSFTHCYVTLSGAINHYFTHLEILEGRFPQPMLDEKALAERAEHLHWLVDMIFERLALEAAQPS